MLLQAQRVAQHSAHNYTNYDHITPTTLLGTACLSQYAFLYRLLKMSAYVWCISLQQAEITSEVLTGRFSSSSAVVHSASYPPVKANRVAAYQWQCCGVNTAEQKKLCLYTGGSFPIRYINFKINFNAQVKPLIQNVVRQVSLTLLMMTRRRYNGYPAQYERNRRFRDLVSDSSAWLMNKSAKLPSEGLGTSNVYTRTSMLQTHIVVP